MNALEIEETFLSIQAQDFIEDHKIQSGRFEDVKFLSIQAQDFIEEAAEEKKHIC